MIELAAQVRAIDAEAEPLRVARDKVFADAAEQAAPIRAKIDEIEGQVEPMRAELAAVIGARKVAMVREKELRALIRAARAKGEPMREIVSSLETMARIKADDITPKINALRDRAAPLKAEMVEINEALGGPTLSKSGLQ